MMQLKQGDPCRVRILRTGNVVDAIYDQALGAKEHCVKIVGIGNEYYLAINRSPSRIDPEFPYYCRFVGPAGVRE